MDSDLDQVIGDLAISRFKIMVIFGLKSDNIR